MKLDFKLTVDKNNEQEVEEYEQILAYGSVLKETFELQGIDLKECQKNGDLVIEETEDSNNIYLSIAWSSTTKHNALEETCNDNKIVLTFDGVEN